MEFCFFAACSRGDVDEPFFGCRVPGGACDGGVEAEVRIEFVFLSNVGEVGEDFFLPGIFACPVGVLRETEGVEGGPDVAAAAGVFVI